MKDFYIIEYLIDILYYPFKLEIYELENIGKIDPEITRIFLLSYRLLLNVIKEYRPNELWAS